MAGAGASFGLAEYFELMRVGFLLNHYDLHQVPHIVPYAFELSILRPAADVVIYCSSAEEEAFARRIATGYPGQRARFERLHIPLWARIADPLARSLAFIRKDVALRANAALFGKLDALVVPEMTSAKLKDMPAFGTTKLVLTGHGAGDFKNTGRFNARLGSFDLSLLPGQKEARGLLAAGFLHQKNYGISGYPKLEATRKAGGTRRKFFSNDRPVVLYNPHHKRHLTSWHKFGAAVLDYFSGQQDFNLIFAPHVLLFKRSLTMGARLGSRHKSTSTILIDPGSEASSDMTYLRSADIYLGDVSSQIYEFVETPRPCVFLDAHHTPWQDDPSYLQWSFGPLISDLAQLPKALQAANAPHFIANQKAAFADTMEMASEEAGLRGARILAEFMETDQVDKQWLLKA
jgi:hypothetical protein